jgi:hypothetical protein
MPTLRRLLGLLTFAAAGSLGSAGGATGFAGAQDSKPDVKSELAAELAALIKAYDAAEAKFYEPYENAKTDEEQRTVRLDFGKHPAGEYRPKFERIAVAARGTDVGLDATVKILALRQAQGGNPAPAFDPIDELVKNYSDSPRLDKVCSQVRYASYANPGKAEAALRAWCGSKHRAVQAAAMASLADVLSNRRAGRQASLDEARILYEGLRTAFASLKDPYGREYAKLASAALFEMDRLQVGMTAPDFEGVDQNGKRVKLSDFRGKVVVLDFWGFW